MEFDFKQIKLVAIASGGGHWIQLMRLSQFTDRFDTTYISTIDKLDEVFDLKEYFKISDCNRNQHLKVILCTIQLLRILCRLKPRVLITTGALPGLISLIICKYLFGSKVIWLDSIANGYELSMSGKIAKKYADLCLSQWEDISRAEKIKFLGAVL